MQVWVAQALKRSSLSSTVSELQAAVEQFEMPLWCDHMGLKLPDRQNTQSSYGTLLTSSLQWNGISR